jgi:hypothetical protein
MSATSGNSERLTCCIKSKCYAAFTFFFETTQFNKPEKNVDKSLHCHQGTTRKCWSFSSPSLLCPSPSQFNTQSNLPTYNYLSSTGSHSVPTSSHCIVPAHFTTAPQAISFKFTAPIATLIGLTWSRHLTIWGYFITSDLQTRSSLPCLTPQTIIPLSYPLNSYQEHYQCHNIPFGGTQTAITLLSSGDVLTFTPPW